MNARTPVGPGAAGTLVGLVRAAAHGVSCMRRALRHRRQVQEMLELDDRTLKDIGLTRLDVAQALSRPLGEDPSHVLSQTSGTRRSAWRHVAGRRG